MKIKPRSTASINVTVTRTNGDFVDGIYKINSSEKFETIVNVLPYNGMYLQNNRDLQIIKSSITIFSTEEINLGDNIEFKNRNYVVKRVDPYFLGNLAHFESIGFEYDEVL